MNENKDNLSKFIKNRLAKIEDTNDHWDKPDIAVWENVQSQLLPLKKEKKRSFLFWLYGLGLAMLLFLSLFFNGYLMQQNKKMEKELTKQVEVVAHLQEQVHKDLKNQQTENQQKTQIIEKLTDINHQIQESYKYIGQQNRALLRERNALKLSILAEKLKKENLLFEKEDTITEKKWSSIAEKLPYLSAKSLMLLSNLESRELALDLPESNLPIIEKKESTNKFEIGLNYGLSKFKLPSKIGFNEDKKKVEKHNEVVAPTYHLHLAYSLKKNWWLKTGFRYSNYNYTNNFQFKTEYDKSKEYEKADGTLSNNLPIETSNGFFRTTQNIEINVPEDAILETGDYVFGEFEEQQQIKNWQIPVGITYQRRNHKFGWQMEASMLLNMMAFSEIELTGKIQSTQNEFATEIINKQYASAAAKLLFGVQSGFGLHYQLSKHWMVRTDALFQYNNYFFNQNIQVGLGYQF